MIGPIRRIDARLAAIASGDFSGHVDVANRDELGALAANVNRMNDELDRLYRELETASEHKSEFLASMSHELRTPLNAIIGFSQVLRERMFGELNEKQEEYLDDILASGHHLLSLINDVLDLSKVEAGQVELDVAPFSLREALESGVVMVRERASDERRARSCTSADSEVELVEGDERRIRQVDLQPAVERREVHAGGRCGRRECLHSVNGEVRVSVARTQGPGSRPRTSERIFEEFQQTELGIEQRGGNGPRASRSRNGSSSYTAAGSGSTARSARGSTFVFTLPSEAVLADGRRAGPRRRGQRDEHEAVPGRPARRAAIAALEATTGAQAVELANRARARRSC